MSTTLQPTPFVDLTSPGRIPRNRRRRTSASPSLSATNTTNTSAVPEIVVIDSDSEQDVEVVVQRSVQNPAGNTTTSTSTTSNYFIDEGLHQLGDPTTLHNTSRNIRTGLNLGYGISTNIGNGNNPSGGPIRGTTRSRSTFFQGYLLSAFFNNSHASAFHPYRPSGFSANSINNNTAGPFSSTNSNTTIITDSINLDEFPTPTTTSISGNLANNPTNSSNNNTAIAIATTTTNNNSNNNNPNNNNNNSNSNNNNNNNSSSNNNNNELEFLPIAPTPQRRNNAAVNKPPMQGHAVNLNESMKLICANCDSLLGEGLWTLNCSHVVCAECAKSFLAGSKKLCPSCQAKVKKNNMLQLYV